MAVGEIEQHKNGLVVCEALINELFVADVDIFKLAVFEPVQRQTHTAQLGDMRTELHVGVGHVVQIQTRAQVVVALPGALALQGKLAAVIDRRHARHGKEQRVDIIEMVFVAQLARHTVDVVVVNKVKGIDVLIDAAVRKLTVERMGDLKVVVVVVARINALVALIVGDGIEHFAADNAVVVAADHLAVEPKFGIFALAGLAELFEELAVHHIRRVQTQTVNAEFVDPEADRIEQILHDLGILQIQLDQIVVTCPALIPKRVAVGAAAVKVQILEPAAVG